MEIEEDWEIDVPASVLAQLESYAKEHRLSLEDALVRLAETSLDLRDLGRRLGADGLSSPPSST